MAEIIPIENPSDDQPLNHRNTGRITLITANSGFERRASAITESTAEAIAGTGRAVIMR